MFTNIVVGTDGSATANAAFGRAVELAKAHGATLHVACAYKSADAIAGAGDPLAGGLAHIASTSEAELAKLAEGVLEKATADAKKQKVNVETHAAPGNPADVLLEIAETTKADLIVVGNRGMHGARRFLGSVPNAVSHHAACSVLIVQTT